MAQAIVPHADRVAAVLATAPKWVHGRRKVDGRPFVIVPSSSEDRVYYVDARGTECICPDRQERRRTCKHMLAVREHNAVRDAEAFAERPAQPAPTIDRYSVLFPADD